MGLLSSLFGSKTKTTKNPYEQNPWEPQQDYLKYGFEQAKGALTDATKALPNAIAPMTGDQTQFINSGVQSSQQQSTALNGQMAGAVGQARQYGQQAQRQAGQMQGAAGGVGQGLLGGYQAADQSGLAQTGVGSVFGAADQFSNSAQVQGVIDSSLNDVSRAFQTERGNINGAASGGGNINSTRAGVLESRAFDDAADRAAQISSGIRMDALNKGIDTTLTNNAQNIDRSAQQAQLGLAAGGLKLEGQAAAADATRGAFESLNGAQGNAVGQAAQYQQLQQQAQAFGLDLATIPQEHQQKINDMMRTGRMDLVTQYMQAIGGSYGGKGYTSTTSQSPSVFQQVVGGTAAVLGGMKSME